MILALRIGSVLGFAVAIAIFVYTSASTEIGADPHLGLRGLKRRRALERNAAFAAIDPIVRLLARVTAMIPLAGARARIAELLVHGGNWLGLAVEEFLALSLLGAAGGIAAGVLFAWTMEIPDAIVPFLGGLGAALPYIALTGEIGKRAKTINRGLPGAIDLGALCMTAGLGFPQAIAQIVSKSGDPEDPLNEELSLVLRQLELGWTRSRALASFGERVPSEAVRSFVNAVIQSEERGTPLVEVLHIQAQTLRQRRSAKGEEAASRAAVLMLLPLMLIMGAILLLLMGPFIIQGMNSGF